MYYGASATDAMLLTDAVKRAPAYFGTTTGAPVTVAAALLGLFGNDDAQYGWIRTRRIEVRQ